LVKKLSCKGFFKHVFEKTAYNDVNVIKYIACFESHDDLVAERFTGIMLSREYAKIFGLCQEVTLVLKILLTGNGLSTVPLDRIFQRLAEDDGKWLSSETDKIAKTTIIACSLYRKTHYQITEFTNAETIFELLGMTLEIVSC